MSLRYANVFLKFNSNIFNQNSQYTSTKFSIPLRKKEIFAQQTKKIPFSPAPKIQQIGFLSYYN